MCIAIQSKRGTTPSKKALEISFENNQDGCGYAFAYDSKIIIKKGFFSFDEFYKSYIKDNIQHLNKLIHFRIKTSGKIDRANCHPFLINDEIAIIHNGIIPNFGNKKESDTIQFIDLILRPILNEHGFKILYNPIFKKTIIDNIGQSKLAFINNKGQSYIINESLGNYHKGIWYSNRTYCDNPYSFNYGNYMTNYKLDDYYNNCINCDSYLDIDGDFCVECSDNYDGYGYKPRA